MKKYLKHLPLIFAAFLLISCGSNSTEQVVTLKAEENAPPANDLESQTLYYVNRYRASKGLPQLQSHPGLTQLAREHSSNMYQRENMSHFDFAKRAKISQKKYQMGAMSENLHKAWGLIPSGNSITTYWANSPKHRKNMEGKFTHAGLGMKKVGTDLYTTLLLGNQVTKNSTNSSLEPLLIF